MGNGQTKHATKYATKYATKNAFKNQEVKKEETKPIAIAEDNDNMFENLKRHATLAELAESGLTQTQQTTEIQNCNIQDDMDIADGIPHMEDTETSNDFGFLDDMDMTHHIEQAGFAQAQPTSSTASTPAQKCEKIALSEEEEERIEALFLKRAEDQYLEYRYKIRTLREDVIRGVSPEETKEKLKISSKEYERLLESLRVIDQVDYEMPGGIYKVRTMTIGDNGVIISKSNIRAIGAGEDYIVGKITYPSYDAENKQIIVSLYTG